MAGKRFPYAHARHSQWRMAAALVVAQLRAQMVMPEFADQPRLALLYITDHYVAEAQDILAYLGEELPQVNAWAGASGVGICANNVEYFDEPALAVMLCDFEPEQFRVFNGLAPLPPLSAEPHAQGFVAHTALLHADGNTPELSGLIEEMAERTTSGHVFGGLASSRGDCVQFSSTGQEGAKAFVGGLSGVAFARDVALISRVTQGAQPVGRPHRVTETEDHVVLALDGAPALDVLLNELGVTLDLPQQAVSRLRSTLVGLRMPDVAGLTTPSNRLAGVRGQFGDDVLVRHLIGLDPNRQGFAVAGSVPEGTTLTFCERHVQAARADLVRICAELREELTPQIWFQEVVDGQLVQEGEPYAEQEILGAVYVSCAGRGGPHFGGPSAELQIVRNALGDVPLVGFFAGGEIAHHHLYGYTGVLTVFVGTLSNR